MSVIKKAMYHQSSSIDAKHGLYASRTSMVNRDCHSHSHVRRRNLICVMFCVSLFGLLGCCAFEEEPETLPSSASEETAATDEADHIAGVDEREDLKNLTRQELPDDETREQPERLQRRDAPEKETHREAPREANNKSESYYDESEEVDDSEEFIIDDPQTVALLNRYLTNFSELGSVMDGFDIEDTATSDSYICLFSAGHAIWHDFDNLNPCPTASGLTWVNIPYTELQGYANDYFGEALAVSSIDSNLGTSQEQEALVCIDTILDGEGGVAHTTSITEIGEQRYFVEFDIYRDKRVHFDEYGNNRSDFVELDASFFQATQEGLTDALGSPIACGFAEVEIVGDEDNPIFWLRSYSL
ncbi:hypothetical protein [Adlercreutzia agrestimuris]|uniref:hypothetical protein n=1 Tax=Adlercreutzia agrestimuris TaxID=2941324 RepID=UPI00203FCBA1|nr:hypothetical protein [Adlercreutzia agrestimuris]